MQETSYEAAPKRTPWGIADSVESIAAGIWWVSTPSHGGVKLDRKRNASVPEYMRAVGGWYEEDCDWSIPAVVFPEHFAGQFDAAVATLKNWHPDEFERFFGQQIAEGESLKRDEALFSERHANDLVVVSACGDWHSTVPAGMIGVEARRGGRRGEGESVKLLIPADEYKPGRFGFVVVEPHNYQTWIGA